MKTLIITHGFWLAPVLLGLCAAAADDSGSALGKALTFHASFDGGADAAFGPGDRRIYTAASYKKGEEARPGIGNPDVSIVRGEGRFGDGLKFSKKNTRAIYYRAEKNVPFNAQSWNGSVSFWLKLDPETDLEPGFCDPIQITDDAYNDSAIWVDFTKDEKPRHFRLGVFGDLKAWNPQNLEPDKNPAFMNRLVVVRKTPFSRDRWTQVAITYSRLGSGSGSARLYLDGRLQGEAKGIREPFSWDLSRAAIRLGVNYVGLFDELAVFNRALSDAEVQALFQLAGGAASLHK